MSQATCDLRDIARSLPPPEVTERPDGIQPWSQEQRLRTGNIWVFLGSGLAPRVRRRVRAAIVGARVDECVRMDAAA